MTLLKHPTAGTIIDVTGARAKTLTERGYQEVDADDPDFARQAAAPSGTQAVQPQPPIDTRTDPPEPPIEARPDSEVGEPPIDTRPENPLGATADSVEDADGAGLSQREFDVDTANVTELKAEADRLGLEVEGTGKGGNVTKGDLVKALKAND